MNKSDFKLIDGGLLHSSINTERKEFVECYITNTRLMGVLAMYMHFDLPDNPTVPAIHQFFYFDAEEFGFESYSSVKGNDMNRVRELEAGLMGGLGGEKKSISLRDAQYILQQYVEYNKRRGIPLPEGFDEYGFLLSPTIKMSEPDRYILMYRVCTKPENEYEVVNYFLMRLFGKDFTAARFLADPSVELELFPDFKAGTFCKNVVDKGEQKGSYICESVVEQDGDYYLTVTSVMVKHMRIVEYKRVNSCKISPMEAAMLLSRYEYVIVYDIVSPNAPAFQRNTTRLAERSMITNYDSGNLFMVFHPNNKHVAQKEYRLNEDVLGMYFVSKSGQVIIAAYTEREINKMEVDFVASSFGRSYAVPKERFQFREPVLYDFIQSGLDSFQEFVDIIKVGDE